MPKNFGEAHRSYRSIQSVSSNVAIPAHEFIRLARMFEAGIDHSAPTGPKLVVEVQWSDHSKSSCRSGRAKSRSDGIVWVRRSGEPRGNLPAIDGLRTIRYNGSAGWIIALCR